MPAIDINLFAGAGGMALGLTASGFAPSLLYEFDQHACATLRDNDIPIKPALLDGIREVDVRDVDWREVQGLATPVRLLAAGVPCQPFSLAGKHLAERDDRNLFPELFRAIRSLEPQALLIENVSGLLRPSFRPYFTYLMWQLESPSLAPTLGESWSDHRSRLQFHRDSDGFQPEYRVSWKMLDGADYGVPQNRRRVFIVAIRHDLPLTYRFPQPTHSRAALKRVQHSGEYWDRYGIPTSRHQSPPPPPKEESELLSPWVTVRDAISTLPNPAPSQDGARMNHWAIPGARLYPGHSGSRLDWPSKTIKAGVHGVPGGENVVVNRRGEIRYYTLRETARIQTFPDHYQFNGARIHVTRQIGNAVPPRIAQAVSRPLFALLSAITSVVKDYTHG